MKNVYYPFALFRKGICLLRESALNNPMSDELINYGDLALKSFDRTERTIEERAIFIYSIGGDLFETTRDVNISAVNFILQNWKQRDNHNVFWNLEISCLSMVKFGIHFLEDDQVLMREDNLNLYLKFCDLFVESTNELLKIGTM